VTVAHVREKEGADYIEVVFLESARFYKVLKENPRYNECLRLLRDAMVRKRVLKVQFASVHSEISEAVQEPTTGI
jgi:hypothetical protein